MNKLFKLLQESFGDAPQRNGFDNSFRNVCSTKVGIKLPVFCLETVPNDYHEIKPVNLIRTMPMHQANFLRMKQHLDFYWVPYTAIVSSFNEWIQQTNDPVNSFLVGDKSTLLPQISLAWLFAGMCFGAFCYGRGEQDFQQFDDFMGFQEVQADDFEFAAKIFADSDSVDPGLDTKFTAALDMFGNPLCLGTCRLLDMLGYGNFVYFVDKLATAPADLDPVDLQYIREYFYRIFIALGDKRVNLMRLAAYQCIYQNFGINTTYDKLDIYSYNFDDLVSEGITDILFRSSRAGKTSFELVRGLFTLRYSQWKKDIFTSAYPDSQFGGVSVVSINNSIAGVTSTVPGSDRLTIGMRISTSEFLGVPAGSASVSNARMISSSFSILDLRRAEALQGWKEDMMRSGFRARSRQRSQFGVAPSYDTHLMPVPLGSITSVIDKDTVVGTSGDVFAEERSRGISTTGSEQIKFDGRERNDFGVIIGILTILPDADYDSFGLDMHNIKNDPFDFYTPAFANIGLQPIPSAALNVFGNAFHAASDWLPVIHGYVPRYAEYKQKSDLVHGEFCDLRIYGNLADPDEVAVRPGKMSSFVATHYDMQEFGLTALGSLYVNPAVADNIFVVKANGFQSTDQFDVNNYFEVNSVRPMSVLGLPRWI